MARGGGGGGGTYKYSAAGNVPRDGVAFSRLHGLTIIAVHFQYSY